MPENKNNRILVLALAFPQSRQFFCSFQSTEILEQANEKGSAEENCGKALVKYSIGQKLALRASLHRWIEWNETANMLVKGTFSRSHVS